MSKNRILGVDLGDKNIGLAISTSNLNMSLPYKIVHFKNNETLVEDLLEIIAEKEIDKIVIGVPYNVDGTDSSQTKKIKKQIEFLKENISVPIIGYDERFTTFAAHSFGEKLNLSNKKRKKKIDKIAASIILQDYLNSIKNIER